jgi:hypothetical protein
LIGAVKQTSDLVGAAAAAAVPEGKMSRNRLWAAILLIADVVFVFVLPMLDALTDIVTIVFLAATGFSPCFASDGSLGLGVDDDRDMTIAISLAILAAVAGGVGLVWLGVAAYRRWPRGDAFAYKLRTCLTRISDDTSTKTLCTAEGWWTSLHALQLFLLLFEDVPTVVAAFFVAGVLPLPPVQLAAVVVSIIVSCKTAATFASLLFSERTIGCCCRQRTARFFSRCRAVACVLIFLVLAAFLAGLLVYFLISISFATVSESDLARLQLRSRRFENSVGVSLVQSNVAFAGASESFGAWTGDAAVWMTKNSPTLASRVAFRWEGGILETLAASQFDGDMAWPFTTLLTKLSVQSTEHVVLVPDITAGRPVLLALFVNACVEAHSNATLLPPGHILLSRSFAENVGELFLPDCAFDPRSTAPCSSALLLNIDNVDSLSSFCGRPCSSGTSVCRTFSNSTAAIKWTRTFGKTIQAADCY